MHITQKAHPHADLSIPYWHTSNEPANDLLCCHRTIGHTMLIVQAVKKMFESPSPVFACCVAFDTFLGAIQYNIFNIYAPMIFYGIYMIFLQ